MLLLLQFDNFLLHTCALDYQLVGIRIMFDNELDIMICVNMDVMIMSLVVGDIRGTHVSLYSLSTSRLNPITVHFYMFDKE